MGHFKRALERGEIETVRSNVIDDRLSPSNISAIRDGGAIGMVYAPATIHAIGRHAGGGEPVNVVDLHSPSMREEIKVRARQMVVGHDVISKLPGPILKVVDGVLREVTLVPRYRPAPETAPQLPPDITLRKYEALLKTMSGPTIAERPVVEVPAPTPRVIENLIEQAKELGYTEVYAAFRYREEAEGDRLLDCMMIAPTFEEAVGKLLVLAGYDQAEAEMLELDTFDVGGVDDLCKRLKALTRDTYEICSYEMPHDPVG